MNALVKIAADGPYCLPGCPYRDPRFAGLCYLRSHTKADVLPIRTSVNESTKRTRFCRKAEVKP
jgi:hypothetical protein